MYFQNPAPSKIGAVPNAEQTATAKQRNFQGPSRKFIQSLIVYLVLGAFIVGLLFFYARW
jgi:hypothetical protein